MSRRALAVLAGTLVVVAALVTVVALVASSGSGTSSESSYTLRANAVCRTAGRKTRPLIERLTTAAESLISSGEDKASPHATGELRELYGTATVTLAKLRAIKEPTDRTSIGQFLTAFAIVTKALGRAVNTAAAGQLQKALLEVESAASASQQMTSTAKSSGLTACESALAVLP